MAKKKKKTTRRTHRRRRMGAVASHGLGADVMEVAGLVAGSVVGTIAQRQFASVNPKIISAGQLAVGFYLKNHSTHPFMRGVGWGTLGAGAIGLTHEFGVIHGLEDMVSDLWSGGEYYEQIPAGNGGFANSMHVAGFANSHRVAGDMNDDTNIPPLGM